MRGALGALVVLLSGCTATFIGDRAYRSPPEGEPAPHEEIAFGRTMQQMAIVENNETREMDECWRRASKYRRAMNNSKGTLANLVYYGGNPPDWEYAVSLKTVLR